MEVLELNGVKYVKASSIARDLGYTADYVGQLCRSGKVDAQLVGRSWYVSESSIKEHKKSRYRSNTAKTTTALKAELSKDEKDGPEKVAVHVTAKNTFKPKPARPHFYNRSSSEVSMYEEDGAELIPTLKKREQSDKSTEVEVRLAGAKPVAIKKTHTSYSLEATERPKIRFKGEVSIVEPEESQETEIEQKEVEHPAVKEPEPIAQEKKPAKPKIRTLSASEVLARERMKSKMMQITEESDDRETLSQLPLKHAGAVAMTRKNPAHTHGATELRVASVETQQQPASGRYTFLYITASLLLGLALSAGLAFTETALVATDNAVDRTFSLNISAVLDSINSLK